MRHLCRMIALAALLLSLTALAEVRAVLVGVGDYQYLYTDLKGPGPDVALMADTLVARGVPFAHITALTTDPGLLRQGIARAVPTRAAIDGALRCRRPMPCRPPATR